MIRITNKVNHVLSLGYGKLIGKLKSEDFDIPLDMHIRRLHEQGFISARVLPETEIQETEKDPAVIPEADSGEKKPRSGRRKRDITVPEDVEETPDEDITIESEMNVDADD